jgi:hypothetical protein
MCRRAVITFHFCTLWCLFAHQCNTMIFFPNENILGIFAIYALFFTNTAKRYSNNYKCCQRHQFLLHLQRTSLRGLDATARRWSSIHRCCPHRHVRRHVRRHRHRRFDPGKLGTAGIPIQQNRLALEHGIGTFCLHLEVRFAQSTCGSVYCSTASSFVGRKLSFDHGREVKIWLEIFDSMSIIRIYDIIHQTISPASAITECRYRRNQGDFSQGQIFIEQWWWWWWCDPGTFGSVFSIR